MQDRQRRESPRAVVVGRRPRDEPLLPYPKPQRADQLRVPYTRAPHDREHAPVAGDGEVEDQLFVEGRHLAGRALVERNEPDVRAIAGHGRQVDSIFDESEPASRSRRRLGGDVEEERPSGGGRHPDTDAALRIDVVEGDSFS